MLQLSFDVENSALHYLRSVGNCQQTTAAMCAEHTFVVEMAIHFSHSGVSWGEPLDHANYGAHKNTGTSHPWKTNAMNNHLRLPPEKRLFRRSFYSLGHKLLPRPEAEVRGMDYGFFVQVLQRET